MGDAEKRLFLTPVQVALLADMGIQLWYERGAGSAPELPTEPRDEQLPREPLERVEFNWIKGGNGMLLSSPDPDSTVLRLLGDILAWGEWVYSKSPERTVRQISRGDFRWPQLAETGGTPARAMQAFLDKHFPEEGGWLALTGEVMDMLEPWLGDQPVTVVRLPSLHGSIKDPNIKKRIWQTFLNQR